MSISTDDFIRGTLNSSAGQPRPLGIVIAINMIDAVNENLVKSGFVSDFYYCWCNNIVSDNLSMDNDLELFGILDDMEITPLCRKRIPSKRRNFYLEAESPQPGVQGRSLYTVLPEHFFWNELVDAPFIAGLGSNQITAPSVAGGRGCYSYPDTGDDEIPLKAGKRLGNRVLWVAPMAKREEPKALASAVSACNYLGLIHHYLKPDMDLCALRLPPNAGSLSISARPTNGDAGSHTRFKVCAVAKHDSNRKKWGTTVNLAKLDKGIANCDGKRERVLDPIRTEQLGCVRRRRLGQINTAYRLTRAQDHAKFADYVKGSSRSGWDGPEIFRQLKAMGI